MRTADEIRKDFAQIHAIAYVLDDEEPIPFLTENAKAKSRAEIFLELLLDIRELELKKYTLLKGLCPDCGNLMGHEESCIFYKKSLLCPECGLSQVNQSWHKDDCSLKPKPTLRLVEAPADYIHPPDAASHTHEIGDVVETPDGEVCKTVDDLLNILNLLPGDLPIVMSRDGEGNGFRDLNEAVRMFYHEQSQSVEDRPFYASVEVLVLWPDG